MIKLDNPRTGPVVPSIEGVRNNDDEDGDARMSDAEHEDSKNGGGQQEQDGNSLSIVAHSFERGGK